MVNIFPPRDTALENDNLGLCSTTEPICSNFFMKSIFTSEDSKRNPQHHLEIFGREES